MLPDESARFADELALSLGSQDFTPVDWPLSFLSAPGPPEVSQSAETVVSNFPFSIKEDTCVTKWYPPIPIAREGDPMTCGFQSFVPNPIGFTYTYCPGQKIVFPIIVTSIL